MIKNSHWQRISALHRQGRLEQAEAGYREILESDPLSVEAMHMLGMLLYQAGREAEALGCLERSIELGQEHPSLLSNTAKVYIERGEPAAALELTKRALQQFPDHFGSLYNQTLALKLLGKWVDALRSVDQAASVQPENAGVQMLKASILRKLGRYDETTLAFTAALKCGADRHECLIGIAESLASQNDRVASMEVLAGIEPADISDTGQVFSGALVLQQLEAWVDAIDWLNEVISRDANHVEALLRRGVFSASLGLTRSAVEDYRQVLSIDPAYQQVHSNFLIQLQYDSKVSAQVIFEAHRDWANQHCSITPRAANSFANSRETRRKLTIAWISPRFDSTIVSSFLLATLKEMPQSEFVLFFYVTKKQPGNTLVSLNGLGRWRTVDGLNDEKLAQLALDDGIDILVDLTGHNPGNRILAISKRMAPVQICWLDYFNTTGVPAVDYWLTDRYLTPEGSERFFTEKLLRLPNTRLCYSPPDFNVMPQRSGRLQGEIILGSFNRPGKITDDVIRVWVEILQSMQHGRLILKAFEFRDERVRELILSRFGEAGLPADRIELRRASGYRQMLDEYADIDIALDPFSFTGCATTCDALWMGVPVITLPGSTAVSRQGLSILNNIGQAGWIAKDARDYQDISHQLANTILTQGFNRLELRAKMAASPLCDAKAQARALSEQLHYAWTRFCEECR